MMLVFSATLFAVFSLTLGESGQFDVTTIYYVGHTHNTYGKSNLDIEEPDIRMVVHSRTNALGLRLSDGYSTLDFKSTQLYNITCYQSSSCNWNLENGGLLTEKNQIIKNDGVYAVGCLTGISFNMPPYRYSYFEVILSFTPTDSQIRNVPQFYKLKLTQNYVYWEKCIVAPYGGSGYRDRDETLFSASCYQILQKQFDYRSSLWISFKDSRIRMWDDYPNKFNDQIMDWKDDNFQGVPPVDVKYFFHNRNEGSSIETIDASLLTSDNLEAHKAIFSPLFSPVSTDVCLVVVFHSRSNNNQLSLFVENQMQIQHPLSTLTETKAGLHYKLVNETLPSGFDSLIRIGIRNMGTEGINIHQLATCNPEGSDVGALEAFPREFFKRGFRVFDVVRASTNSDCFKEEEETAVSTAECQNGGKPVLGGCACPAGFVGPQCDQGCGRNRFGHDCEGVCSLHSQECQGLLLCTPTVGCHCAPGYKGTNCTEHCSEGEYGVSCEGKCGHCAPFTPCDIYTGECPLCAPGYYPPYCNEVYMYCASKPETSSPEYGKITVTFNLTNTEGYGSPKLYQVQYREVGRPWKNYLTNIFTLNTTTISENIEGLQNSVTYEVRVLLMDENFNKYSGDLVPTSLIGTKCDIPSTFDYNIDVRRDTTSISFYWTYVKENDRWCSVKSYEVVWKEDWEELKLTTADNFTVTDLLPGAEIQFKVRALTAGGYAPYSDVTVASTLYRGLSPVRDLHVESIQSKSAKITWLPPRDSRGEKLTYRIKYKCVEQLACPPGCHNSSEGDLVQDTTNISLSPLLPSSQYLVTVALEGGLEKSIYVGTAAIIPQEAPKQSTTRPQKTNTSLTVFWDPVPVCSSYLLGYKYQLVKESESSKVLTSGFTRYTNITLDDLEARTLYIIKVYVVTVTGWNPDVYLSISETTYAKDNILDLTVYKCSRTMLGLRWAVQVTEGEPKSFNITLTQGQDESTYMIEPSRCVVWPDLYCHTIDNLKPNHRYNVTVRALSTDVGEDREAVSILGITKESSPTVPKNLKLVNISSDSAVLQWHHPLLANGIIRSYIINVEEITAYDQESCCRDYPLIEITVTGEEQFYEAEVTDLNTASMYSFSVTAKTVMLGPSQMIEATTRPPHLSVVLPRVDINSVEEWTWQPQANDQNTSSIYSALIKARLLLVVVNDTESVTTSESGINDSAIHSLLQDLIGRHFHFVGEYSKEDELINPATVKDSLWGKPPPPSTWIPGHQYQLIAAQITGYGGVYNADLAFSTIYTLA